MGLKSDLKKAFLQSSGAEEYGEGSEGNVDKLAEGISTAIDNYIKNKKFNITSLDADIKITKLQFLQPLPINTAALTYVTPAGLPAPVVGLATLNPTTLRGDVQVVAQGKAVLGRPARQVKGSKKTEKFNRYGIVELDPDSTKGI